MRGALLEGTFEPVWVEYTRWVPQRGVRRPREEHEHGGVEHRQRQLERRREVPLAAPLVLNAQPLQAEAAEAPAADTLLPALRIETAPPLRAAEAEAPPTTFVAPRKPRRTLGMAQTQAGAPVVVETVKQDE
jgi:hypothetical protein